MVKKTQKILKISFTLIFLISFFFIEAMGAELRWTGCGITKKAFMQELADAYQKKTGNKINIKGGGATKGIRETAAGNSDIGGSCRNKMDIQEEKNANMVIVAWDALVIVVSKDNPVENLTVQQVQDIFLGKIKNWKELGAFDAPINLFVRKGKTSGVGRTLRALVFEDYEIEFSSSAIIMTSSGPLEKAIEKDKTGLGATGISSAKKRSGLKILKIDNKYPNKEILISGEYPYFRPLFLVTNGEPKGEIRKFIDFALSADGQKIISEQGTVNIDEGQELKSIMELEGML